MFYIINCVSKTYIHESNMHFKTHVFPKKVLSRDFAFKHKLGTLMPKTSVEIGEF